MALKRPASPALRQGCRDILCSAAAAVSELRKSSFVGGGWKPFFAASLTLGHFLEADEATAWTVERWPSASAFSVCNDAARSLDSDFSASSHTRRPSSQAVLAAAGIDGIFTGAGKASWVS
ncbi:hypothetical protein HYFRA_00001983 [Hymenoscyphus fraxineus]|uniref:Uncharacterized protein n=1 Tax=Hymenoscyphus fraxineus TaxID=746836 RepID=A0A9N9PME7_9HELO|nr:hypothetical protein HYFRA_00001983 [Hymenoscyphus fraxineus]